MTAEQKWLWLSDVIIEREAKLLITAAQEEGTRPNAINRKIDNIEAEGKRRLCELVRHWET